MSLVKILSHEEAMGNKFPPKLPKEESVESILDRLPANYKWRVLTLYKYKTELSHGYEAWYIDRFHALEMDSKWKTPQAALLELEKKLTSNK